MFLLIDNYDSFTYNLVQAFYSLGHDPLVLKNDDPAILDMARNPDLQMVCISPGPGHPASAGLCPRFLMELDPKTPVLGVCLGHQLLGLNAGAGIDVAKSIMHGKQSEIVHEGEGLFYGLPNPMKVGRYHSLVIVDDDAVASADCPFTVTARGPEGEIMAISYKHRPWVGVQFHPESVLTPDGLRLLENFPGAILGREGEASLLSSALERLACGRDLSASMAVETFGALMDGRMTPAQAGCFLMGLRAKGESPLELSQAVRAALARAVRVEGIEGKVIDVVGTGGDGMRSFNCSTLSALILAGMGYKVVKHGNRAISSACGSADVLEGIGIELECDPQTALRHLDEHNFAFLYAPNFHPAFKNVGPIRKELGFRTIFNMLGPMINPAAPSHLLMGVAAPDMVELAANTLLHTGVQVAAVVYGSGGYDEITPLGPAEAALVRGGRISRIELDPAAFGIAPCSADDLAVGSKEEAIAVFSELLKGRGPGPMLDMATLNVGMAIYILEDGQNLETCMARARAAVMSGLGGKVANAA